MKLSELIEHLACLLSENGDVEVYCWANDGQTVRKTPELNVCVDDEETLVQIDES